ncbi:MAG: hypothetical protein OXG08_03615 [Gammaproteobacteria bacterium]|nr:hypothetical protein [Gammaproteobacteria bacterium]
MRTQIAIFVDAGYLCALGSMALTGEAMPRSRVGINSEVLAQELKQVVRDLVGAKPLLRIYWYEIGSQNRTMSNEQLRICESDDFKLRLVSLHPQNVRTGVATAISRDLMELSRKGSISDALVLARNDTLRTGIEVCQSYGIRVHMLEVFANDNARFSWLRTDVDTSTSWRIDVLQRFLSEQEVAPDSAPVFGQAAPSAPSMSVHSNVPPTARFSEAAIPEQTRETIHSVVKDYIDELYDDELDSCMDYWRTGRGVPNTYDKSLLFECRNALDRNLSESERQVMRNSFRSFVEERVQEIDGSPSENEPSTDQFDSLDDDDGDDFEDVDFNR